MPGSHGASSSLLTAPEWERWLEGHPQTHLLQTAAWGELKATFGWQPVRLVAGDCGAQVLFRPLPLGFSVAYLPMGPVGTAEPADWAGLLPALDRLCRSRRAILLKTEPDPLTPPIPGPPAFFPSPDGVQPPRTLVVDLSDFPAGTLSRMRQKTRYNIRLAGKKGVAVRAGDDLAAFNALMQVTGRRDRFGVHTSAYYQRAFELFHSRGECALFTAYYQNRPLAGVMAFARGARAWYLYGASAGEERQRMAPYLAQWAALEWAAARGCQTYDLYGVPDCDEATLEAQFRSRSDGLWGVYRFKRGFGGRLARAPGAFDRVYIPALYWIYRRLVRNA
ncbi:MAG: peptidoglycan bridge formation glycyltransferase FemA/FemB family protein [Chloroflexi bacterium]|nr:peptidoglycan bridge formation glycyltransferase FemA/FemB family protein [Chloroflexota bacterium]